MLTAEGEPTTDPKHAEILLPLGGPKGSGLALMFELVASVLAAAPIQARTLGPERRTRNTGNTAMFVIDIATFRPIADFAHDTDTLAAILKALPTVGDTLFRQVDPAIIAAKPQYELRPTAEAWSKLKD